MTDKSKEKEVKIDMHQMGEFLRNLRKSEGLSQEVLAKYLFVSRQAISLWENGDTLPEHESIICICNFFKITADELYKGMYDDPKRQTLLYKILMNKQVQKYKRLLITFIVFIVLTIIGFSIFTIRYFFIVHNNVNVYNIGSDIDKYDIKGELSQSVNDINMFLSVNTNVDKLCILYKDNINDRTVLCGNNTNTLSLYETLGYNELLPDVKFDDLINNLYIVINDKNDSIVSKLNLVKFFQNTDVSFNKEKDIDSEKVIPLSDSEVPEKIKKTFKYDKEENKYYLEVKEDKHYYYIEYLLYNNELDVQEVIGNKIKTFHYYIYLKMLDSYSEFFNGKLERNIDDFSDKDTNKEKQEIYNYFEKNYLRKYVY